MTHTPPILVTGAAGFIASRVCGLLLDAGWEVVGVDNLNDAYDVGLKRRRLGELCVRAGFEFHQADITDVNAIRGVWSSHNGGPRAPFSAVINLAARAGVRQSVADPWIYYETNVTGTLNLLQLCHEHQVGKFVLASTSSLYGAGNPQPFREDYNTDGPLSPYAASKKAAEVLCYTYHHLYDLDVTVLRYFTVYGPAGRPDMSLFRFAQWIAEERPLTVYGDGQQSRDFTYVEDIARGTVAALKPVGYEVINLGSDRPTVLMDAIGIIEELSGRKANVTFGPPQVSDVRATWADINKAKSLLGWEPRWSLADGLSQLVGWYNTNRVWARNIPTS
jgi:nucleoside-diphosphate-sugar epimerase